MADFDQIQRAYERGLRQLADDLIAEFGPADGRQQQITLIDGLLCAVVRAYGAHQSITAEPLDVQTSVMYAAEEAGAGGGGVLNVPLRSLVEYNSLTSWQARFLNGSLGMKRTIFITGPPQTGRSTLLNSLVQLITVDQRIVVVEGDESLPALRDRSFTVRIPARTGTPSLVNALEKGAGMRPTWMLVEHLGTSDGPPYLRTLAQGFSGIATIDSPDPELALTDWIANNAEAALHLSKISPLVAHMDRDSGGRPRVAKLYEATVDETTMRLILTEKRAS
ncbi:MAG: P-loop NTPase family protein [Thermoleophilia bacterium]